MYSPNIPKFKYLSITVSKDRQNAYICLQLRKKLNRKRFSIGKESQENFDRAIESAYAIERYCDGQIARKEAIYLNEIKKIVENIKNPQATVISGIDICSLWKKYVDFHLSLGCWTETYRLTHIQVVENQIARDDFPQSIEKPFEILQWLLNKKCSVETAKIRFKTIVCAVDWASKNDVVDRKYGLKYRDCLSTLNRKLKQKNKDSEKDFEEKFDSFSKEEVLSILEAFKTETYTRFKRKHSQYYPFLKFLWLTGCRPCEAVALKWSNVLFEEGKIKFAEGEIIASGKRIKRKGTKTQPFRHFPINTDLLELLQSIPQSDNYVFLREDGKPIHLHTLDKIWKGILPKIGIRFRVLYQLRHSMISYHANRGFPLTQLAEIVGNSEKVIRKHYLKVDISLINVPIVE